ncbi:hypothetical protein HELRODRAFT_194794 [Helobdella robusta]|uniref:CX domain-containing protein n=1 Tax=Helobdella robusta TaxID=6412 RepID=T1FWF0_HELRO|nr:hypothetical protein HELRODRAFT_194794 [Helobdella robusta]ESN89837.1 hypothetical protein HELRODRAFT_194794 [Helobdella robusta]
MNNLFKFGTLILTFLILILLNLVTDCEGKRGGGGFKSSGGFKSTKIHTSNTYNTKISVTKNKYYSGGYNRPWGYGYNSWYTYGSYGHIYGFVWYTQTSTYRNNPNKEPTICRNEFDNLMDNGTHYEWFICPSQNHTSDFHYCCGQPDKEYCCRFADNGWRVFGTSASVVVFFLLCCCCCYCCCFGFTKVSRDGFGQQRQPYFRRIFIQKFSTRTDTVIDPSASLDPELYPPYPAQPAQPTPYPPLGPQQQGLFPQQPPPPGFIEGPSLGFNQRPSPGFIQQPPYPSDAPYFPQASPMNPAQPFTMPDPNYPINVGPVYPPPPPPAAVASIPLAPPSYAPAGQGFALPPTAPPPPYKE